MQKNTVAIHLAGKKLNIPCSPSDAADLQVAADALNQVISQSKSVQPLETRLLMISLNLSYELLQADRFTKSLENDLATALRQLQRLMEEQGKEDS